MKGELERARQRMEEYLSGRGLKMASPWPEGERKAVTQPVVVVTLRECRGEEGGFLRYLGERFTGETGRWEEQYGCRAQLTFGLDLYAPARGEGADLRGQWDVLAAALAGGSPEGMEVLSFSCGETEYDPAARLRKGKGEVKCRLWLHAPGQDGVLFSDFILRGDWKI